MHTTQPKFDNTAHSLLRDTRYTMIPHQLRGVTAGLAAMALEADRQGLAARESQGGDAVRHAELVAYTRPVICVAAIHCRLLLRFLGLQSIGSATLGVVGPEQRRAGEAWIGMFNAGDGSALTTVPPSVVESYADPQAVVQAWTITCDFSAQSLASAITDPRLTSGAIAPMLRRAFETIPELVSNGFYERAVLRTNR